MRITGLDRDLPTLPGTGLNADRLQRDGEQPGRDLFAGSHDGVIFARVMHWRGLAAPVHQLIGLARHRRDHYRHVVSRVDLAFDVARDIADAFDIGDGGAAEFHHEAAHDDWCVPLRGFVIKAVRKAAARSLKGAYT